MPVVPVVVVVAVLLLKPNSTMMMKSRPIRATEKRDEYTLGPNHLQ